jgi:cyclophilin family peptidyl-prolyl cis-trans isomerase
MRALLVAVALAALAPPPARAAQHPRLADERVLLRTSRGDLVLALYPEVAPRHTAQILSLVRLGVYDSTYVYRVEPGFVAQLCNAQNRKRPLSPQQQAAIVRLPAELSSVPHTLGVLSMAREDGDLDSAETSFSFMLGPAPHLDGKYTVFGEVESGFPLLAMLAREPRDERNAPRTPVIIEQALVRTADDIARMRLAGQLREATAAPADDGGAQGLPPAATVGVLLMLGCSLLAFSVRGRWSPRQVGALNLVVVLIGAFVLVGGHLGRARQSSLVGTALFFGVVALFRVMSRFESPAPQERGPRAAAARSEPQGQPAEPP